VTTRLLVCPSSVVFQRDIKTGDAHAVPSTLCESRLEVWLPRQNQCLPDRYSGLPDTGRPMPPPPPTPPSHGWLRRPSETGNCTAYVTKNEILGRNPREYGIQVNGTSLISRLRQPCRSILWLTSNQMSNARTIAGPSEPIPPGHQPLGTYHLHGRANHHRLGYRPPGCNTGPFPACFRIGRVCLTYLTFGKIPAIIPASAELVKGSRR
jgi:hypothetical protein